MTDEQRKALTEYLGERWHEWIKCPEVGLQAKCSCGMLYDVTSYNRADILYIHRNRTFDNRNDLMDLYVKIYEDGKWDEFFWFSASHCKPKREGLGCSETTAWLFCLNGKDYEEKCRMVAEFYGWKEKS